MKTFNEAWFPCSAAAAFRLAREVERWPERLPHYRWVRFHEGDARKGGTVEMAAYRDFPRFRWPIWWVSRMATDPEQLTVEYHHLAGVTRGMDVRWQIHPEGSGCRVVVEHWWEEGPAFCGPAARAVARQVVGPLFVHFVADQTLSHLAQYARREMAR